MKWLAPIIVVIALLQYTAPSGHPLWIAREQIVAIGAPVTCGPEAGSRIFTSNSAMCVRESIDDAVKKFQIESAK